MKKLNVITIISIVAQVISIYYSFQFFNSINTFFGVIIVLFESVLFFITPRIRTMELGKKVITILIVSIIYLFSILGVVSNGYNFILKDNQNQFKQAKNDKYNDYIKTKELKENNLKLYQEQLKNYPALETFTANSPKWEDKTIIIQKYSEGKQVIQDQINKINSEIDNLKAPAKTITIKIKTSGYNAMLDKINKMTGIKVENCILILTLIVAITLQMIILVCRIYKNESLGQNVLENKSLGYSRTPEIAIDSKIIEDESSNKTSVLENKNPRTPEIIIDTRVDILEKNNSLGQNILEYPRNPRTTLDNVLGYLRETYNKNECIEKFQSKFNLSEYEYKKIRCQLIDLKIIETKNRRMYYIGNNLRAIK